MATPESIKAIKARYRESHREEIRSQSRAAYQEKKTERQEWFRKRRAENLEHVQEIERRSRDKRRDKIREATRVYKANNKEKISKAGKVYREKFPERRRETMREYAKRHPEQLLALRHARRARQMASEGTYTPEEINRLYGKQDGKCAACKVKMGTSPKSQNKYQIDHVMPLALGGSNWIANIQLLCRRCNFSKNAKHPDMWAAEHGLLFV